MAAAEMFEDRIRERAYHIWEAAGRPSGRDEEFWHRACEMVATTDGQPRSTVQRRKPERTKSAKPPRKPAHQTSPPVSPVVSAPAG